MSIVVNAVERRHLPAAPDARRRLGLGLLVTNERDIAAAEAVRAQDDGRNTGTGVISVPVRRPAVQVPSLPATPIT